jgi:hypothetical protein
VARILQRIVGIYKARNVIGSGFFIVFNHPFLQFIARRIVGIVNSTFIANGYGLRQVKVVVANGAYVFISVNNHVAVCIVIIIIVAVGAGLSVFLLPSVVTQFNCCCVALFRVWFAMRQKKFASRIKSLNTSSEVAQVLNLSTLLNGQLATYTLTKT